MFLAYKAMYSNIFLCLFSNLTFSFKGPSCAERYQSSQGNFLMLQSLKICVECFTDFGGQAAQVLSVEL